MIKGNPPFYTNNQVYFAKKFCRYLSLDAGPRDVFQHAGVDPETRSTNDVVDPTRRMGAAASLFPLHSNECVPGRAVLT